MVAVALGISLLTAAAGTGPLLYGILGTYLAYSLVVALRGRVHAGMLGLLAIFGDTVFFLIMASFGGEQMPWVASFFFLYILTETLVFYSPVELAVIAAVSAVFCAVLPYGSSVLVRTVVATGALACAFAINKRGQSMQIDGLKEKLVETEKLAEKARETERMRIASDFHDGPLQSFISLQMRLEILRKLMERDLNAGMNDLKQLQGL